MDNDYKPIFHMGIFYPTIKFNYSRQDSDRYACVNIWYIREIKGMKYNYKTKRFVLSLDSVSNCDVKVLVGGPSLYFIELKNEKATISTSTADFIAGAKLTLFCLFYGII